MSDHTPGPWMGRLGRARIIRAITDADGGRNIVNWNGIASPTSPQSQANARLIAAAPDMYRELAHLVRLLEPMEQGGTLNVPGLATLNGARAALAKAEAK